jgi:peptidyl-prolyl cis-trans isomerase A (cyclophilin A)
MTTTKLTKKLPLQTIACLLLATGLTLSSGWGITVNNPTPTPTPTPPPTPKPSPNPIATIPNAFVPFNGTSLKLNLGKYLPSPWNTNTGSANAVFVNTSSGNFFIQLFPTNAPQTVANFLRYVTNGIYNGMTFHRSVPGFIIQTGGYDINPSLMYTSLTNFGTIPSEAGISNLTGTVAMALGTNELGETDPNSGSSGWFVNLVDNSSQLDTTNNGPFTVFGQVIGTNGTSSNGMAVVDSIAALPTTSAGPFPDLPLINWNSNSSIAYTNLEIVTNMATVPSVTCIPSNSFSASFQGTNLVVTPLSQSTSPTTVYITTTDTNGFLIAKIFQVSTRKFYQTINFPYFDYVQYSTNLYSLTNSPTVSSGSSVAASGLPVSISVSGPASMTNVVSGGVTNSMIQFKGAGWVQVIAKQPGNFFYNAAPPVSGWIQVFKAFQTIHFTAPPDQTNFVGPTALILTNYPTATSGLPVTVSVKSGPAKIIPGGHGQLPGHALTLLGAGTVTLIANQAGNTNYYPASPTTNSFVVTQAP